MKKTKINIEKLEKVTHLLKSIAHPVRLSIIMLLDEHKTLAVTNIYQRLLLEQAIVSHHLSILKNIEVVSVKRDGKHIYYSLTSSKVMQLVTTGDKLIKP